MYQSHLLKKIFYNDTANGSMNTFILFIEKFSINTRTPFGPIFLYSSGFEAEIVQNIIIIWNFRRKKCALIEINFLFS